MNKTIEQLVALSKNPHYKMTQEELKMFEEYRRQEIKKHTTGFSVETGSFKKHDPELNEE